MVQGNNNEMSWHTDKEFNMKEDLLALISCWQTINLLIKMYDYNQPIKRYIGTQQNNYGNRLQYSKSLISLLNVILIFSIISDCINWIVIQNIIHVIEIA